MSVELDLRQSRKCHINSDELGALVTIQSLSFRPLDGELELLADCDQLGFEVLVLCSHILDTVITLVALLLWNNHITLVTALRDKLTGSFVRSKVLLIQLFFAAKVCAFDSRIFAIGHVALQVKVADDLLAAFLRVLAAGFDHRELLLQERMRVYQVESG